MPLLNKIFHKSYGNLAGNLKAVSDRGWYPANRKLVEHPSLIDDETSEPAAEGSQASTESAAASTATGLNSGGNGMTATVLDRILAERARSDGAKRAARGYWPPKAFTPSQIQGLLRRIWNAKKLRRKSASRVRSTKRLTRTKECPSPWTRNGFAVIIGSGVPHPSLPQPHLPAQAMMRTQGTYRPMPSPDCSAWLLTPSLNRIMMRKRIFEEAARNPSPQE